MRNRITIPSDFSYLKDVEIFIQELLEGAHVSEFISGYINLCICESVSNAIYHGNNQDLKKNVTIFAECKDEFLIVEVRDEGKGFDYINLPDPTLSENLRKEGGRGLFIIRNLVDQLVFKNNGSVIQLTFKLNSEHQFLLRRRHSSSSG
ncbi:MAG: ATP-binding protein [Prolixibacteraceae bacterium]